MSGKPVVSQNALQSPAAGVCLDALMSAVRFCGRVAQRISQKWCREAQELHRRRFSGKSRYTYDRWIADHDVLDDGARAAVRRVIVSMPAHPVISVVMPVYNPRPEFLEQAVESVRSQLYPHWELCIADDASTDPGVAWLLRGYQESDARVKVVFRKENGHISEASNSAAALAGGDRLALLDQDDVLAEHALFWVALEIVKHPDAGLIFSDEDKIDPEGRRRDPYFKCEWDPDLFCSSNTVNHLGVYDTAIFRELGGFRKGFEGSQDWDLALRFIERMGPRRVRHIPRVLYHWRMHPDSISLNGECKPYAQNAAERALDEHFARLGTGAKAVSLSIGHRIRYLPPEPLPRVSLVVSATGGPILLCNCLRSLLEKTAYPDFEILLAGNRRLPPAVGRLFGGRVRVLRFPRSMGAEAMRNRAVGEAGGAVVGFIDGRLEAVDGDWLHEMASHACRPEVGAVGGRVLYLSGKICRGGIVLGLGGKFAGDVHRGKRPPCYFGQGSLIQGFSAVSGVCMAIRKEEFLRAGGFAEDLSGYGDVDLCLRLRRAGLRNIWTPYAQFRFLGPGAAEEAGDEAGVRERWKDLPAEDPSYSPNLSLDGDNFQAARRPRVAGLPGPEGLVLK